ncbi:unnamed protein product [Prorocentrum cordatum]|uniref:Uncharacterized protein n=1 Tax=Prorocentrum cordatum TaxID=2364126 RepID=A0ABN9Y6L2_9DINO|nr:unnamed protein product [Polarella glacialis]
MPALRPFGRAIWPEPGKQGLADGGHAPAGSGSTAAALGRSAHRGGSQRPWAAPRRGAARRLRIAPIRLEGRGVAARRKRRRRKRRRRRRRRRRRNDPARKTERPSRAALLREGGGHGLWTRPSQVGGLLPGVEGDLLKARQPRPSPLDGEKITLNASIGRGNSLRRESRSVSRAGVGPEEAHFCARRSQRHHN